MSRLTSVALVCILGFALASPLAAAQPSTAEVDAYLALLEHYAGGDYDGAVNAALDIPFGAADSLLSRAIAGSDSKISALMASKSRGMPTEGELNRLRRARVRLLKLALLVHTEASRKPRQPATTGQQLALSKKVVAQIRRLGDDFHVNGPLSDHDELYGGILAERPTLTPAARARLGRLEWDTLNLLIRDWYLVVVSHLQAVGHLEFLKSHVTESLQLFRDDPELLLARGAISEGEADITVIDRSLASEIYSPDFLQQGRSYLSAAAGDYAAAFERAPELDEATLRWGRINRLLGNRKAARRALGQVASGHAPPALKYLARIFLGQLSEQEREPAAAATEYETALSLVPAAQTPMLALSRLCDAMADDVCARRWLQRSFDAAGQGRANPWWQYQRGQAWMVDARLARFRARGLGK